MAEPTILHADLDAFYASVEQRDRPELRGQPVIVGRGVVLSASYEARRMGVRTPMALGKALSLCPAATVVEPRFSAYTEASRAVFAIFEDTTPVVEGVSIDEAFLDVRGMERLSGTPREIATRLRARVKHDVGLPITIGVARTKFLAKVASDLAKPDGLLVVPADGELAFLHPLPVGALWGVGPVTARKLNAHGLLTVAQVAATDEAQLNAWLGPALGRHLHALANNRDPRPVHVGHRRRSIGSQSAMGRTYRSQAALDTIVLGLIERVARRLRAARRVCRTVVLRLRFDDFTRATRSHTLVRATDETGLLLEAARALLTAAWPTIRERGITLLGISLSNLEPADAVQLPLVFGRARNAAVDAAIDGVRNRFGSAAITRAALLGRDVGFSVPLLPD